MLSFLFFVQFPVLGNKWQQCINLFGNLERVLRRDFISSDILAKSHKRRHLPVDN